MSKSNQPPTIDGLIECLKACNEKLEGLCTSEYRFVAWIIYSTRLKAFVAGVDTYTNGEENMQHVPEKAVDASPVGAMNAIYRKILEWEDTGKVIDPFN